MAIRIEIYKVPYNEFWEIRTGDLDGSTTISNVSKETILKEINSEMEEELKKFQKENNSELNKNGGKNEKRFK